MAPMVRRTRFTRYEDRSDERSEELADARSEEWTAAHGEERPGGRNRGGEMRKFVILIKLACISGCGVVILPQ